MKRILCICLASLLCLAASPSSKINIGGNNIQLGAAARPAKPLVDVTITSIRQGKMLADESGCLVISGIVVSHLDSPRYDLTVNIEFFGVFPNCQPHPQTDRYSNVEVVIAGPTPGKPMPFITAINWKYSGINYLFYLVSTTYAPTAPILDK